MQGDTAFGKPLEPFFRPLNPAAGGGRADPQPLPHLGEGQALSVIQGDSFPLAGGQLGFHPLLQNGAVELALAAVVLPRGLGQVVQAVV